MKVINLYRYRDEDANIVTPNKRNDNDTPALFRLIADEGKIFTDGITQTPCVDTEDVEKWQEIIDNTGDDFNE